MTRELLLDLATLFRLEGARSANPFEGERLMGIADELGDRALASSTPAADAVTSRDGRRVHPLER